MQVVREYYANFATLEATLKVGFEGSEISLEIPVDGIVTREGWTISPFTFPTVSETFYCKFPLPYIYSRL